MAISKISDPVLWQNRPKRTLFVPSIVTMTIWESPPRGSDAVSCVWEGVSRTWEGVSMAEEAI